MFTFPKELITQKYYKLLNINEQSTIAEANKSLKDLYHEYHQTQFNLDILYRQIQELSISYEIINDPIKKKLYDNYGDYVFEKIIDPEHFDNNLLNHLFQSSENSYEPLFIELSLEKMHSGTDLTIKYQSKDLSKKIFNLELVIPKRSKSNDLISVIVEKEKINIFLKQKKDSPFVSFGYNLLHFDDILFYDILLNNTYTFSNLYGNKLSFEMSQIKLWTPVKFDNHGLSSNNSKHRYSLFLLLNITNPNTYNYNNRILIQLLKSSEYQLTQIDIIGLLKILLKDDQSQKTSPQTLKETNVRLKNAMSLIEKEDISQQKCLCQRLIFTILNNYLIKK